MHFNIGMLPILRLFIGLLALAWLVSAEPAYNIRIDGHFTDWTNVKSYSDPLDLPDGSIFQDGVPDVHDTDSRDRCDKPPHVFNPIVDILEVKFAHSETHLFGVRFLSLTKKPENPDAKESSPAIRLIRNESR